MAELKGQEARLAVIADYAKTNDIVHQLIDLALLQNGMLEKIKKVII